MRRQRECCHLMLLKVGRRGKTLLSISVERSTLTEDQHLTLELIADDLLPATAEIVRDMLALMAFRLIEMTPGGQVARYKARRGCAAATRPLATLGGSIRDNPNPPTSISP